MTPRARGGDNSEENLLLLRIERHFYWHKLFDKRVGIKTVPRTLEEVILLPQRVHRMKGRYFEKLGLLFMRGMYEVLYRFEG